MRRFSGLGTGRPAQGAVRRALRTFFRWIRAHQLGADVSRFAELAGRGEAFDGVREIPGRARGVVLRATQSRGKLVELGSARIAPCPARLAGGFLEPVRIEVGFGGSRCRPRFGARYRE